MRATKEGEVMQRSYEYSFLTIGALFLSLMLGVSVGASAQGKGHGGDRGGPPPGKGGGSPQQVQRQEQRQQPQAQRQEQRQQPQQRQEQPRFERAPVQRQQQPQANPGWQNRGGQYQGRNPVEQPRPQQQPRFERAPVQRQQQQENPAWQNRGWQNQGRTRVEQPRPQQPQYRNERKPDFNRVQQQPQYDAQRGQGNGGWRHDQRQDNRGGVDLRQTGRTASGNHAWPNNYGYQRSTEVHARNADRQAMRNQESFWREQARVSGRSFDGHNFRRDYQQRTQWRDNTLRNVISNVLVGNSDNYYYTPQYDTYNYNYGYNYGYGSQYDPYYYNNGGYWNGYTQYQSYYATPYSLGYQMFGYQPYDYSYSDYSYYSDGYPYYSDYYANDFPLVYVSNSYGSYGTYRRGGFLSQLFSQLLAVGYDNGYQQGLYARSNGYGDRYYDDPYVYQDTSYEPYSYSVSENRRCLSEGYQLGYQDALYGNRQYDPYARGGNTNLVSLLIGGVLNRG
jgi:hypothetical protein